MGKLRQLLIPKKDSNKQAQPEYGIDMRAIEQWAKQLEGIGFYASLTGPGETTTPGGLVQRGYFFVSGTTNYLTGDNFRVDAFTGKITIISESGDILIANNDGQVLIETVNDGGGLHTTLGLATAGAGVAEISGDVTTLISNIIGSKIGFFGTNPGVTKPNVTGSRGGNAALASVLSGLDALGLITDSSTP